MDNRTDWVDYAKAIGIILVVYGHVARGLVNAGIDFPATFFKLADSIVYSFHMPLFFFLSGLFFYGSFSKRGAKGILFNKIDTIVYPYILWSVLQGTIEVLLLNFTNGNVTFQEVFSFLWSPRAQFWFLYALFIVFIVSTVIYSFVSEKYTLAIFLFSVFLYVFQSYLPEPIKDYVGQNLVFFSFGVLFKKYSFDRGFSSSFSLGVMTLLFIGAQYYFHLQLDKTFEDKGLESLVLALISILFVVTLSSLLSKTSNQLLMFMGSSSMSIYVMHVLAGSGARVILNKAFGVDSLFLHLIFGCFVSLFAPLAVLIIVKKMELRYFFTAPLSRLFVLKSKGQI